MNCVIEMGTSCTRIRFVSENGSVLKDSISDFGARNAAIEGSNLVLKKGIHDLVFNMLEEEKLSPDDIENVIAFAMVTADIGLYQVEHLVSPVGFEELVDHVESVIIPEIFENKPIFLIPGVRNRADKITFENLNELDFMRGEETQVFGLIKDQTDRGTLQLPCFFLMLSSYSKLIYINKDKKIAKATTHVTGQLFPGIMQQTFLSGMLPSDFPTVDSFNEELFVQGYNFAKVHGFTRALMMIRLSQYFMELAKKDAMALLEGMVCCLDMEEMQKFLVGNDAKTIIIAGDSYRLLAYSTALKNILGYKGPIITIEEDEMNRISVKGALEILDHVTTHKG